MQAWQAWQAYVRVIIGDPEYPDERAEPNFNALAQVERDAWEAVAARAVLEPE